MIIILVVRNAFHYKGYRRLNYGPFMYAQRIVRNVKHLKRWAFSIFAGFL